MIYLMFAIQGLLILYIAFLVLTGKFKHSFALPWTLGIIIIPVVLISTDLLEKTSKFLGFQLTSNFILVITMIFLILNSIWLLSIVGRLEEKTRYLIMEIAIIRNEEGKNIKD